MIVVIILMIVVIITMIRIPKKVNILIRTSLPTNTNDND